MKLLVVLVATSAASPLEELLDSEGMAVEGAEAGAYREGRLNSVFEVAKFPNGACTTNDTSAPTGSCFLAGECSALGGEAGGGCAQRLGVTLGVCCKVVVHGDGSTVSMNNSHIVNPGFPNKLTDSSRKADLPKSYVYTIKKASSTVDQIRLEFLNFNITQPNKGSCKEDWLIIEGAEPELKNLCGLLTGQHVYLSVKYVETVTITVTVTSARNQKWNMLVRQFEATQKEYLAPRGCLQYFKEDAGSFSTFNNDGGDGQLLNDHNYSVCIGKNQAYGDVYLTASNFNLTNCNDRVEFGSSYYCGSTFPSHTWKFPGSYKINLYSDGDNSGEVPGFMINFLLMPRYDLIA